LLDPGVGYVDASFHDDKDQLMADVSVSEAVPVQYLYLYFFTCGAGMQLAVPRQGNPTMIGKNEGEGQERVMQIRKKVETRCRGGVS
jgi:hypothetical protein